MKYVLRLVRRCVAGLVAWAALGIALSLPSGAESFIVKDGRAYFQVGGAVVYDSEPEAEYQETLDKARALVAALNLPAEGGG